LSELDSFDSYGLCVRTKIRDRDYGLP